MILAVEVDRCTFCPFFIWAYVSSPLYRLSLLYHLSRGFIFHSAETYPLEDPGERKIGTSIEPKPKKIFFP